jgi:hypothetical protein
VPKEEPVTAAPYEKLLEYVSGLDIIDTHEHLPYRESVRSRDTDFLCEYLSQYFFRDLVSAGLAPSDYRRAVDRALPLPERWRVVEPYWDHCRNTGYARALDLSVKALYGIDGINRSNLEKIEESFRGSLEGGHFEKVLAKTAKIKIALLDHFLDCDRRYFRSVYRLDQFVAPDTRADVQWVERETGVAVTGLDDWMAACEVMLDKVLSAGAVALKSGLAYQRPLSYEKVSRSDAETEFNELFGVMHLPDWQNPGIRLGKKAQDFMMHHLCRLANRRGLTFQFHTGFFEGNGNLISNGDPALLSNLFLMYPDITFDLFHMAYPYQQVLPALAKPFANVTLNLCWAHTISPEAAVRALVEWLDAVPANKIMAFGGDSGFIDAVAGSAALARMNVARALATKIADGVMDLGRAQEVARMLFFDNPMRVYRLNGKI